MSDEPESPPPHIAIASSPADPRPAEVRPGLRAPIPESRDPRWAERLSAAMGLDELLAAARAIRRIARHPEQDPAWPEVRDRLRVARAMLEDALDEDPHCRAAIEYLSQIRRYLGPTRP